MSKSVRHFLDISELPPKELRNMLAAGVAMKAKLKAHEKNRKPLEGKTLAMIFERPSTRTRVSFDVGMRQLGGESIMLTSAEMQLRRGGAITGNAPEAGVRGADCVVTDTWVSMGYKDGEHRHNVLKPYQVNAQLMSLAKPDALFMHCLPAHRGEEVTDEVIDGPQSVVFDEAENRLHAQKGILAWCFDAVK